MKRQRKIAGHQRLYLEQDLALKLHDFDAVVSRLRHTIEAVRCEFEMKRLDFEYAETPYPTLEAFPMPKVQRHYHPNQGEKSTPSTGLAGISKSFVLELLSVIYDLQAMLSYASEKVEEDLEDPQYQLPFDGDRHHNRSFDNIPF